MTDSIQNADVIPEIAPMKREEKKQVSNVKRFQLAEARRAKKIKKADRERRDKELLEKEKNFYQLQEELAKTKHIIEKQERELKRREELLLTREQALDTKTSMRKQERSKFIVF